MTTNNTNNEMLTVNTDSVAPECRNLDVMMTGNDTREDLESALHDEMYKSEALLRYAEENDFRVIDLLLATIDDTDCDGLPGYDRHWSSEIQLSDTVVQSKH